MSTGHVHYLILAPLIYIGIITSIEDFRFGKIYRRHITLGISIGLAWLIALALFHWLFLGDTVMATSILPRALATAVLALAISFGMWWFNVWSAADAKLFSVFTLMLPVAVYETLGSPLVIALTLMVNGYAVAFIVISIDFLIRFGSRVQHGFAGYRSANNEDRSAMIAAAKDYLAANTFGWVKTFAGFTFLLLIIRIVRNLARAELQTFIHWDETTVFLILFLAFRPLHVLFQIRIVAAAIIIALIGYAGWLLNKDPSGAELQHMARIGAWALGLMTFRQVYTYWSSLVEVRLIPLDELQAHMIISQSTKDWLMQEQIFDTNEMKAIGVEGLEEENVQRILEHYENDAHPGQIEIENTIPMAPFLFAGLIATLIVGGVLVRLG